MYDLDGKVCFKCNEYKTYDLYYKHSGMPDGYLNKCKECAKFDARENRANNIEYYRAYDKKRSFDKHRVEARIAYQNTEIGKAVATKAKKKWHEANLIKRAASHLVNNAVRDKRLEKKDSCEVCNISGVRMHGHHDDYAFPLSVRWLCPQCHRNWHKEHGSAKNG